MDQSILQLYPLPVAKGNLKGSTFRTIFGSMPEKWTRICICQFCNQHGWAYCRSPFQWERDGGS